MARPRFKFTRTCEYCGREFKPTGKMNLRCDYCKNKSHEYARLVKSFLSFKRMLGGFFMDKEKPWYKEFKVVIKQLEKIIKDMGKEVQNEKRKSNKSIIG
jgi:DNA-directed RNA polymerase subunit RPC12/RpoP